MNNLEIFSIIVGYDVSKNNRMKSIVNKNERTPSLYFYYNKYYDDYFFKDFSSGEHGGPIKFLMLRDNISYQQAKDIVNAIIQRKDMLITNKANVKQKVIEYDLIKYEHEDLKFWETYNIDKYFLVKHNVYPIKNVRVNGTYIFRRAIGYFNNNGMLLQIYCPANSIYNESEKKKFITVDNKIFHTSNNSNILVLTKSKKDIVVADKVFNEKVDLMSPMGETTKLYKDVYFLSTITKYNKKIIIFDNDKTGMEMAEKYKEYGFKVCYVKDEKDISDYVKKYGYNINNMFEPKIDMV